jgi:recombination protein RecT
MSSQALKAAATGKQQGDIVNRNQHPILAKTDYLEKRKELLGSGIPGHMVIEREIRTATVMLMNSKDLQEAKVDSFYTAVSIAVNSGIGLGNGKGYLVAYKGNVSYVPGWKGLVDLVSRTGRASVWTGIVHAGDEFDYALGDSPFLKHKPGDNENHADITHYYAIGRVKGSEWPVIEVWTAYKVKKHLDKYNKVGPRHYAHKDENNFEMYGRKVVLLQALKYLPQSQDLENAINAEIASETGKGATIDGNFVFINDDECPDMPADITDVQDNAAPPSEFMVLKNRMQAAKNIDYLNEAADLINTIENPDHRIDLANIYETKKQQFTQ